ncbi:MAG TPA: xanthine dehydrogenase family protein molybdopterin-binding subunit [Granulicella sp.]
MMQNQTSATPAGQLEHRYDGIAKVTGKAKYAAEFTEPFAKKDLVYAYIVQSTIPSGSIASIDQKEAERAFGVIAVLTPFNAPQLTSAKPHNLSILQDADVHYNGQPIAVVLATSLPFARHAARLLKIQHNPQPAKLNFMGRLDEARLPKQGGKEQPGTVRGDLASSMTKATVTIDETYITPIQNHNPMEPHATIAWWAGEKLNVYDATQYISGVKMSLSRILNLPPENVRVQCPYTGGGFGCKGTAWSHVMLAAMAAKIVQKPVKLVLERDQMFGPVGARPTTVNKIKIGADASGRIVGIQHDAIMHTSMMDEFVEHSAGPSRMLYNSEANSATEKMVEMNLGMGTYMRAPGEASGTAVLEIAMDELAHKLNMDPVQLRLVNYAETDPSHNRPFSSKHLRECYTQAADRFGWSKRNSQPRQTSEGHKLIGYGMATATYPANRSAATAIVRILPNGHAFVGCGTQDIGTGMYTIMAQTAAAALGLDPTLVEARLGDSALPKAPVSGGSQSTASVLPAVDVAAKQAKFKLFQLAIQDSRSPLYNANDTDLDTKDGRIFLKSNPSTGESFMALLTRNGSQSIEAEGSAQPAADRASMTTQSFGAVFAEVAVDKDTHMVQVRRVVGTYDIGTLMNNKTGLNQLMGGIVWGVGFALHEETVIDPVYGRTVNENFADYHVPVNADIGDIDVSVLNIPDTKFNPLGSRGIGEIGITGAAAAVANAIYNATGKRVRHYPITPDKIMQA